MSTLKSNLIEPATATTLTLGASGDSLTASSDSLQTNLYKDAGGNTLFQSDGAGTISNINSGLKGAGPILISSQTASGSASISFTSGINNTYDNYMFVFVNISPASNVDSFGFQVNTSYNQAITSTYFRVLHAEDDSAASLAYDNGRDSANSTSYCQLCGDPGGGSDESTSGVMYLYAPSNTSYVKNFSATTCCYRSDDKILQNWIGGYVNIASAIDKINFQMNTGNFDGTIKMYGIT